MATRADTHGLTSHGLLRLLIAAIVALALVLTLEATPAAAQSPTTAEELLSGMVTEEVEPGVYRIVNDGVRDLTRLGGGPYWGPAVLVDGTGWVWRIGPGEHSYSFRLGAQEERSICGLQTFR